MIQLDSNAFFQKLIQIKAKLYRGLAYLCEKEQNSNAKSETKDIL